MRKFAFILLLVVMMSGLQSGLGRAAPENVTTRVSVGTAGQEGNAGSFTAATSADGRVVAFHSDATNLVAGDGNSVKDIFVRDRPAGTLTRVSVSSGGGEGNGESSNPALSGNGRFVAFQSRASNLVPGDTNNATDVFVHDRQNGATSRVSVSSGGVQGNASSYDPALSFDGRYVAFWSIASNLVATDSNVKADVFVHDRQTGATFRVSLAGNGQQGNDDSSRPAISDDGRFVAFESYASNLVANDLNQYKDIFVHDLSALSTTRVSSGAGGVEGQGDSYNSTISRDGGHVAFTSLAGNLVPGDTNLKADVFLFNRGSGVLSRVSVSDGEAQADDSSGQAALAAGGRYVAFQSAANNLVNGDGNGSTDVFLRDTVEGRTTRLSVATGGGEANGTSARPALTASAEEIIFDSTATNLVDDDSNGVHDVFVNARNESPPPPPPPPPVLVVDHHVGAPGSCFAFAGSDFPAGAAVSVSANGTFLGLVDATVVGEIAFEVCTSQFPPTGYYLIRAVDETGPAVASVRTGIGAPLRPSSGVTPSFTTQAGLAYDNLRFMPLVAR